MIHIVFRLRIMLIYGSVIGKLIDTLNEDDTRCCCLIRLFASIEMQKSEPREYSPVGRRTQEIKFIPFASSV